MASVPFIDLSPAQLDAFVKRLDAIRVGSLWSSSRSHSGRTLVKDVVSKKSDESKGTLRVYYVRRQSEDLVDERLDQHANVLFSPEDVLIGILSSIPGHERSEGEPYGQL